MLKGQGLAIFNLADQGAIGSLNMNNKKIACAVAIETQNWGRPSEIALAQGPGFMAAVSASPKPLPGKTAKEIQL